MAAVKPLTKKKKSVSARKREAIIEAAKRAFQADGVEGTSMDRIAELAGVSKRTVYNHFPSKEDLVLFLISELWQQSMVQIDVPYDASAPLEGQLAALVSAEVELVTDREFLGLARIAAGHFLYHPEALQEMIAELAAQETALTRWLTAATADGRLRSMDVAFAHAQLHSLIKGSCYYPQLLGIEVELDTAQKTRLIDETVAMFLNHYRSAISGSPASS